MSILKRPEEVIMAVLGALFVVLTYAAASYFGAQGQTALLVAALTLIVLLPAFLLWQRNRAAWLWPAGRLLVAVFRCPRRTIAAGGLVAAGCRSCGFSPALVCGLDV